MLKIAIQYPEVYTLTKFNSRNESSKLSSKPQHNKEIRKMMEFVIITFAMWLYPDATWAVTFVKFCFLLWDLLQK
jgi:hypothetical protein